MRAPLCVHNQVPITCAANSKRGMTSLRRAVGFPANKSICRNKSHLKRRKNCLPSTYEGGVHALLLQRFHLALSVQPLALPSAKAVCGSTASTAPVRIGLCIDVRPPVMSRPNKSRIVSRASLGHFGAHKMRTSPGLCTTFRRVEFYRGTFPIQIRVGRLCRSGRGIGIAFSCRFSILCWRVGVLAYSVFSTVGGEYKRDENRKADFWENSG